MSIVIPAYNEADRLPRSLPPLVEHLRSRAETFELLVVDDGSTDETVGVAGDLLGDFAAGRVIGCEHRGKGAAVRSGVLAARGRRVIFMDADLATDLAAITPVLAALDHADVVLGSRQASGSVVIGFTRTGAIAHRLFARIARIATRVPVNDFQCGFKAFKAEAAEQIFTRVEEPGFAFDVEVLLVAHRAGMAIVEVPVRWTSVAGSHVHRASDAFTMLAHLARIVARHRH